MAHIWRTLSFFVFLLPAVYAQADDCLTAIIGDTVQIPCSLNTKESLKAEDISVEWTAGDDGLIVYSFVKGEDNLTNQDPQFKNRAQLFKSKLSRGNFSLSLSNVSVTDRGEFKCHYYNSSIGDNSSKLLSKHCLQVAAHFTDPVVNRTPSGVNNSEYKFNCTSDGGYPEPKVHWAVNNVSVVDSSRINTTLSKDSRGLYSVTSILTVNVTVNESVTCTIENEKLKKNKIWAKPENNKIYLVIGLLALVAVVLIALMIPIVRIWRRQTVPREDNDIEVPLQQSPTVCER